MKRFVLWNILILMLLLFDCKLSANPIENHGIIYVNSAPLYSFEKVSLGLRSENQFYEKEKTLSDEHKIGLEK